MGSFISKFSKVIIENSTTNTYHSAVNEWGFKPPLNDRGQRDGKCQLCGTPIRYEYTIENEYNSNTLLTGCDCIKRFIDESDHYDKENFKDTMRKAEKELEKSKVKGMLLDLKEKDFWFSQVDDKGISRADSFEQAYRKYGYFSPRQLIMVSKGLKKIGEDETIGILSTSIKKGDYKEQLLKFTKEEFELVYLALSDNQRKTYLNNIK